MTHDDRSAVRAIERRRVSRKTPGDGKLEITKVGAGRMESLGETFRVVVDARSGHARLGSMPCTCRGADRPHVHYFLESDLFRSLTAGTEVDLLLDDEHHRLLVVPA